MNKQKSNDTRYNYYSSLSTKELENLLKLDFQAPQQDDLSLDDLKIILNIVVQRSENEQNDSTFDATKSWHSFKENYLAFAEKNESLYDFPKNTVHTSTPKKHFLLYKKNIATAVVLCLFLGLCSTTAIAQDLLHEIATWSKEVFWFNTTSSTGNSSNSSTELDIDMQRIFHFNEIPPNLIPTHLPGTLTQTYQKIYENSFEKCIITLYENEILDTTIRIRVSYLFSDVTNIYEKDSSDVSIYQKDGIDYYIMNNLDTVSAIWKNGSFECQISGNITRDELKQIIDSIPSA